MSNNNLAPDYTTDIEENSVTLRGLPAKDVYALIGPETQVGSRSVVPGISGVKASSEDGSIRLELAAGVSAGEVEAVLHGYFEDLYARRANTEARLIRSRT